MFDLRKLQPVANRVIQQGFDAGLASLPEEDRVFFLLWSFAGMVDNGGLAPFFYNSSADYYPETVDALRGVGLTTFAGVLESAAHLLFAGDVPRTMDERNSVIEDLPEEVGSDEQFEQLDRQYFDHGGGDQVLEVLDTWYFSRGA
jgi:hypothetical protein